MELLEIGKRAREAESKIRGLSTNKKNNLLLQCAEDLQKHTGEIIAANEEDMNKCKENGMSQGILDRLLLTKERIDSMAAGLCQLATLDDPVGEVLSMKKRPNGLLIGQKRVPLGVVGIIYEARPNVTADAFGLCFKTENVVILKGGRDALSSNRAIGASIR